MTDTASPPLPLRPERGWPALLFGAAIVSAIPAWTWHALPVLGAYSPQRHAGHFGYVWLHAAGGTGMLMLGLASLYVGWTRRARRWHKPLGYAYLATGALGAGAGLALSMINAHPPRGVGFATGTLAVTWLAVATMALRAAINRHFEKHREWMIRSYVLTWTFVLCRLVMRADPLGPLGTEGVTAIIWMAWVVPLLACDFTLRWNKLERQ